MICLDRRTARLVAIGASVSANCHICLETSIKEARREKIVEKEIADAAQIGKMVRNCTASNMDEFASKIGLAFALRPSKGKASRSCPGVRHER